MNMASHHSSVEDCNIIFVGLDGEQLPQPVEWTPCWIEITGSINWENAELLFQGERLELGKTRKFGRMGIFTELPRQGSGRYLLELRNGVLVCRRSFTVSPHKFSEKAFHRLLDDVQFNLPYGLALSLQKIGGLTGINVDPWKESIKEREFILLRRAIYGSEKSGPGLLRIINMLSQSPHRALVDERPWVESHTARRPCPSGFLRALCHPGNLTADNTPLSLPDRRVQVSVNTFENKVILFLHDLACKRLRRLSRVKWSELGECRQQIERMISDLAVARNKASFLNEVSRLTEPPSRVTMAQIKLPAYRASLGTLLELLRVISVQLDHPAMEHSLENIPTLYQYWGTLLIIQALVLVAEQYGFLVTRQCLMQRDITGLVLSVFPHGVAALSLKHPSSGTLINLYPEKQFMGGQRNPNGYFSLSYQKRPDICVEVLKPGFPPQLLLFDPKYKLSFDNQSDDKTGEPLRADIDKMHTYRDAISHRDVKRPVVFAGIVYPGQTRHFSDGLSALGCIPGECGMDDVCTVLNRYFDSL